MAGQYAHPEYQCRALPERRPVGGTPNGTTWVVGKSVTRAVADNLSGAISEEGALSDTPRLVLEHMACFRPALLKVDSTAGRAIPCGGCCARCWIPLEPVDKVPAVTEEADVNIE